MSRKAKLWTAALVVTGVLALAIAGVALAQDPAGTADDSGYYCPGWGYHDGATGTVSQLLGLTPQEIHDEWLAGKSLSDIAQAQGVSQAELVDAIMAVREEAVQQRVANGYITQEQADLMLQQMRENTGYMVNGTAGAADDDDFCGYGQSGSGMGPGMMQDWGQGDGTRSGGWGGMMGGGRGGMMGGGWGGGMMGNSWGGFR